MEANELVHRLYQLKPEWDWWLYSNVETDEWKLVWKDEVGKHGKVRIDRGIEAEAVLQLVAA